MSMYDDLERLFKTEGYNWKLTYGGPNNVFQITGVSWERQEGKPLVGVHGFGRDIEEALEMAQDKLGTKEQDA